MKSLFRFKDTDLKVIQKLNMRSPWTWLATWFGSGFLHPAPGTWGTLGALPFGIILAMSTMPALMLIVIIATTYIGTLATQKFEDMTGTHDNSMIVIDEAAGLFFTMLPLCYYWTSLDSGTHGWLIVLSFLFFRFFDVLKPWPCGVIDRKMNTPFGVMADDLVAGLYAATCLTGVILYAGSG